LGHNGLDLGLHKRYIEDLCIRYEQCGCAIIQKRTYAPLQKSYVTGWSKKWHKVYGTIILQPYITESCALQQYVLKEILYMTKVSV